MKNKISDLNDHLFAQLERLNDENLKGDDLHSEINRAKAIAGVASQIVNGAKITLDAMKLYGSGKVDEVALQKVIGTGK